MSFIPDQHVNTGVIKEFFMENMKPLIVLGTSIVTAHSPLKEFLNYEWNLWIPFLEVVKTSLSVIAIIISTGLIILNYLKKKHNV